jgi:hypothetical protein
VQVQHTAKLLLPLLLEPLRGVCLSLHQPEWLLLLLLLLLLQLQLLQLLLLLILQDTGRQLVLLPVCGRDRLCAGHGPERG